MSCRESGKGEELEIHRAKIAGVKSLEEKVRRYPRESGERSRFKEARLVGRRRRGRSPHENHAPPIVIRIGENDSSGIECYPKEGGQGTAIATKSLPGLKKFRGKKEREKRTNYANNK